MAKSKYIWLFNKRVLTKFAFSDEKPRYWYSYNKKDNCKEIRVVSIEKHINEAGFSAYHFIAGPFEFVVGWI